MILGFLLTALYWPGIAGAATTPRWDLLAVASPVVLLFTNSAALNGGSLRPDWDMWWFKSTTAYAGRRDGKDMRPALVFTSIHLLGVLFLTWSAISLIWTPNRLDGAGELIKLVILALAFLYGSSLVSLRPVLIGMACGLILSSVIVFLQLSYPEIVFHTTAHSGLFINSGSLGEISALVIIGLIHATSNVGLRVRGRLWLCTAIVCLLPCVVLPESRGAWLALIAAFTLWLWSKSKLSAVILIALAVISFTYSLHIGFHVSSVTQRIGIWSDAIAGMTWLGHGLGSFWTDYAPLSNTLDTFIERPEHLHNDWLEIIFELGPFGFALVGGSYFHVDDCGVPYLVPLYSSSSGFPWKAWSVSRFMSRVRPLLLRCVLVMLLGMGLTYAVCSMAAEFDYMNGMTHGDMRERVSELRDGAKWFPFDRRFRTASALLLGNLSLQSTDEWKKVAIPEIQHALMTDPTQADLLAMIVAMDLTMGRNDEAQRYYNQFKRVAKKSLLLDLVRQAKR